MKGKRFLSVALATAFVVGVSAAGQPDYSNAQQPTSYKSCSSRSSELSTGDMNQIKGGKPIDGICFIAGVCTGFWPIGTALCGPTAVGCAVYYWQS
jgi:hypothetical protein